MASKISIIVSAKNAGREIVGPVKSAKILSSDVLIFNIGRDKNTASFAIKSGAKVIDIPDTPFVETIRELTIRKTSAPWVFLLDTDERVTKELAIEIKKAIKDNSYTHYKIPRKNIYGRKKWLRYGGWWPDHQIRLINKEYFVSWPKEIHSTPVIKGDLGYLKNPLLHYFHGDFESMVEKTIKFEDIESDLLYKAGRKVSTATFFRKFIGELYRRLFKKMGFLDGAVGIIESIYQAFSRTITWIFLYEKKKKSRSI